MYTDEELIDNIHDSSWRIQNLYKIRNKKSKTIPFALNATQKVLHASTDRFNMTLKGRQQGVSTYYILKYADMAFWNKNVNVAILSHDRESIKKLFRIVAFAYKTMPDHLKPELARGGGSAYEMYFPDLNSRISVTLEVRSESISHLHISEYGLMKNKDRFNASIEAVPFDVGHISIESTPFGMNHFYDDWFDPDFPYAKHFFPWYFHHENVINDHKLKDSDITESEKEVIEKAKKLGIELTLAQIAWRRFKIAQKGASKFFEEHPEDDVTCFLMSGEPVLDLMEVSKWIKEAPAPIKDDDDGTRIWEERKGTSRYYGGGDTAEGVGGDSSVFSLYEKGTNKKVAQLRNNRWKPKVFAEKINELCSQYVSDRGEWPLVAVERNNHGHAVLLWLEEDLEYPNLFVHTDDKVGWITNKVTRPVMIDTYLEALSSGMVSQPDKDALGELMTLVNNNGKIEAMEGKHDDTVMADSIALQIRDEGASIFDSL